MTIEEVIEKLTDIIDGRLYHIDDIREMAEWAKLHLVMFKSLKEEEGR